MTLRWRCAGRRRARGRRLMLRAAGPGRRAARARRSAAVRGALARHLARSRAGLAAAQHKRSARKGETPCLCANVDAVCSEGSLGDARIGAACAGDAGVPSVQEGLVLTITSYPGPHGRAWAAGSAGSSAPASSTMALPIKKCAPCRAIAASPWPSSAAHSASACARPRSPAAPPSPASRACARPRRPGQAGAAARAPGDGGALGERRPAPRRRLRPPCSRAAQAAPPRRQTCTATTRLGWQHSHVVRVGVG